MGQYLNRSSVPPFFINEYKDKLIDDPQNSTLQIPPNKKDFRDWLKDYVKDDNPGNRFESDLVFKGGDGSDSNQVTASRFFCQYKKLNDADEQVAAMDSLRAEVADLPADIRDKSYAFSFTYVFFEQYKIIERELFQNLALAAGAVFIITTLLIAHIVTSTIVTICVCLTIVDILGVMWIWGLTIDGVNVIQLTLAIGLAVDYSAHIGHAFMQQQGTGGPNNTKERHLRVTTAVAEIGASVINGGISTFLAVLMLSVSRSYVFRSFFKVFFGIVVLGLLHGLMLLPVLLSYCGPAPLSLDDADESKRTSQKESETKKAASSTMEMRSVQCTVSGRFMSTQPIIINGAEAILAAVRNKYGAQHRVWLILQYSCCSAHSKELLLCAQMTNPIVCTVHVLYSFKMLCV